LGVDEDIMVCKALAKLQTTYLQLLTSHDKIQHILNPLKMFEVDTFQLNFNSVK